MFFVKPLVKDPSPALKRYLSLRSLYEGQVYEGGWLKVAICILMQLPVQAFMWVVLHPRFGKVGGLDQKEVETVYSREARTYNRKHHYTTRGGDTWWRRKAGFLVSLAARLKGSEVRVLDVCTGTGLTVTEMTRVLFQSGVKAKVTGIDLTEAMVAEAKKCFLDFPETGEFNFERADATHMTGVVAKGFISFEPDIFDVVTQVFGIGGIPKPSAVFKEVLSVLKPGGTFFLTDMHTPIKDLPGEWWFGRFWKTPLFEAISYEYTTKPLALGRLWGWRGDVSLDYPRARLAVTEYQGRCYGFEELWFDVESERWWFGIPIMTTARLFLRKVEISCEEYKDRLGLGLELESATQRANS